MNTNIYYSQTLQNCDNFSLDTIKEIINDDFKDSKEELYWKRRLKGEYKTIDTSRIFKKKNKKTIRGKRIKSKSVKKWYGFDGKYMDYEAYIYEKGQGKKYVPYRNRAYCIGCKKPKTLFATKAEADNYIKYNRDRILKEKGYAPIRSYFCWSCHGWHVTSREPICREEILSLYSMSES